MLWGWWTLGLRWCWVRVVGVVRRQGWESAMLCTGRGCGEGDGMLCLDVERVVFLGVAVGGEGDIGGYAFVCVVCAVRWWRGRVSCGAGGHWG